MELNIKREIKDYESGDICRVEIITETDEDTKDYKWFLTMHLPAQPIGEAVEEHLRVLKIRRKKVRDHLI